MRTFLRILPTVTCMALLAALALAAGKPKMADKPADDASLKVADPTASKTSAKGAKTFIMVFDFYCKEIETGKQVSEALRTRLRHKEQLEIVDHLTVADNTKPLPIETDPAEAVEIIRDKMACTVGFYGTVTRKGKEALSAEIRCIDLTPGNPNPVKWTKTFSDDSERARGEIAKAVVEAYTGTAEWIAPQYGDEKPPEKFGPPLNVNGDFEAGHKFWDAPDNCASFLEKGPPGRGTILRIRTDIPNDPWLEYHRKLRLGLATTDNPPKLKRDTGYGSVGGNEGVHFCSEYMPTQPGMRYWLTADVKPAAGKIFIKGWYDVSTDANYLDGLPEASMCQRKLAPGADPKLADSWKACEAGKGDLTAVQFTAMPKDQQKKLVLDDAQKFPLRYLRECYRWYVNCERAVQSTDKDGWKHIAAVFPPRGGMPDMIGPRKLKYLQIQIYPYWPAQEYMYDNVWVYKDPRVAAPVAEEAARTANFGKTSDVIEKTTSRPQTQPAGGKK